MVDPHTDKATPCGRCELPHSEVPVEGVSCLIARYLWRV